MLGLFVQFQIIFSYLCWRGNHKNSPKKSNDTMSMTKKLMTLMLTLMMPVTAIALPPYNRINYEFEVDGIYYLIEGDEACVTYQKYENGMHLSDYHNDVVIPAQVTYQGKTYPVTIIDYSAFNYCIGLTSITIPESITTIRDNAFYLCTGLTRVNITDIEAWCKIEMGNCNPLIYANHLYMNGTEVTDLNIPDGITAINKYAFWGCSGLLNVTISNSVTRIDDYAFSGCTGLTKVSIGKSVTYIGKEAFQNATGIETIICKATTPPSWKDRSLFSTNEYYHTALHVPTGCEAVYKSSIYWGQFMTIIGDVTEDLLGDVNGDGEINIADANSVIDIVVMGGNGGHTRVPSEDNVECEQSVDVNGDGEINIADVNAIIKIIIGNN